MHTNRGKTDTYTHMSANVHTHTPAHAPPQILQAKESSNNEQSEFQY